jgi:IclR family acetate operon transcriptional repressor
VARGCQALLWLAEREHGARAKEVAFANCLALPTTYHLLNTLVDQGLLAKDSQRRYVLGRNTARLVEAYQRRYSVSERLLAGLRELTAKTKATGYLAQWAEDDIRVLALAEGRRVVRVAEVASGPYGDAHAKAIGKVLLAHAGPEKRVAYLDSHPLRRLTDATICDPAALEPHLGEILERGYAYDQEESAVGVCCVAAPLLAKGRLIAAFGISERTERFNAARDELTTALLEFVAGLEGEEIRAGAELDPARAA